MADKIGDENVWNWTINIKSLYASQWSNESVFKKAVLNKNELLWEQNRRFVISV